MPACPPILPLGGCPPNLREDVDRHPSQGRPVAEHEPGGRRVPAGMLPLGGCPRERAATLVNMPRRSRPPRRSRIRLLRVKARGGLGPASQASPVRMQPLPVHRRLPRTPLGELRVRPDPEAHARRSATLLLRVALCHAPCASSALRASRVLFSPRRHLQNFAVAPPAFAHPAGLISGPAEPRLSLARLPPGPVTGPSDPRTRFARSLRPQPRPRP